MRVWGLEAYPSVITLPLRLIVRGAEIRGERYAEERITALTDQSIATGLKLGMEYHDPKNPNGSRKADEPYHTLNGLKEHREALDRMARPWAYTAEARAARLDWEQEQAYDRLFSAMQA